MKKEYGLIGYPLGHSFSERYFSRKFDQENIDASYRLFPLIEISMFPGLIKEIENLKGLNVTIPYKESVIRFLNEVSTEAKEIGAVNVIKITTDKNCNPVLTGYNSDFVGFRESLKTFLDKRIEKALVLGTGGASKAVAHALKQLRIEVSFVSRNPNKDMYGYEELNESIISQHLLIVNTTPLGMYPHNDNCPDIPYHLLSDKHFCYDLIYNPEETEFMKRSKMQGAKVKNGLEMLHLQAEEAWKIWNSR